MVGRYIKKGPAFPFVPLFESDDRVYYKDIMGYDDFISELDKYPEAIYRKIKARVLIMLVYKK